MQLIAFLRLLGMFKRRLEDLSLYLNNLGMAQQVSVDFSPSAFTDLQGNTVGAADLYLELHPSMTSDRGPYGINLTLRLKDGWYILGSVSEDPQTAIFSICDVASSIEDLSKRSCEILHNLVKVFLETIHVALAGYSYDLEEENAILKMIRQNAS